MSKSAEIADRIINKVADAKNATKSERQALAIEFGDDPSDFIMKYSAYLTKKDIDDYGDPSPY